MKRMMQVIAARSFLAVAIFSLTVFAATDLSARTVSISSQTDTSVTFAFGGLDNSDCQLYVAHGTADGDDDKHAWTSFEKVADIAYDQTSYEYEVPETLRDGRYLRFFLVQTVGVVCANELKSVSSTGAQWIDTGITPNNKTVVDFRFGNVTYADSTAFFGHKWGGSCYLFNQQGNSFYFHGKGGEKLNVTPVSGVDYRCVIDDESRLILMGNSATNRFSVNRAVSNAKIAIFGCSTGDHLATFTFYRMKIANQGTYQRDFVPAVDSDGVAGLFDQLNNVFYKSETSTALVADEGAAYNDGRTCRVYDSTPSFKFRRTVSVTAATADTVTLAFGNPNGSACKLFAAYGASEAGENKNDWTSYVEVATIGASDTEYVYTLPAELKVPGTFVRFFLVQTDNLPYASELASIKSTGGQIVYIDYVPGADTSVDFRFGDVTYSHQSTFFGQSWAGYNFLFNQQSDKFNFHGAGVAYDAVAASTDYLMQLFEDRKLAISYGDTRNIYDAVDGRTCPFINLVIFGCYSGTRGTTFRFDSMRIKDGGMLVRDLLPVQTSDGKGALFDRITGEVYGNQLTTDFTKGAALARQGWTLNFSDAHKVGTDGILEGFYITGNVTLTEDADWTSCQERLVKGVTVDLNGYTLHLSSPVTDSMAAPITLTGTSGTLRLTVPEETTYENKWLDFTGPVTLLKDGDGMLLITRSTGTMAQLTVEEGIAKYGKALALATGTVVEVKDGAALEINGQQNIVYYKICGTGSDGQGALRNTGASIAHTTGQMTGFELTGDATVYATGHLGLINSDYGATKFELNGHTLTLNLSTGIGFWFCNTSGSTGGTVYTKSGIPYFYKNNTNIPNVDFIIDGANSIFRIPTSGAPSKVAVKSVTVMNNGTFEEGKNITHMKNLTLLDGAKVPNYVCWIYIADTLLVSNETTEVILYPPIINSNTYPKLVKKGAGTLTIANNHTDQRIDKGVEIFGGTVVMSTSRESGGVPHKAISSQAVPVTIHAGGTLDMRQCTSPFLLTALDIEDGGTLLHNSDQTISFTTATFTKPNPFTFTGTVNFATTCTFNLYDYYASEDAPAAGETVTLLEAGAITGSAELIVEGCPYDNEVIITDTKLLLRTKTAAQAAVPPIKIWTVGGIYALQGTPGYAWRQDLAQLLSLEGWNVQMTGCRTGFRRMGTGFYTDHNTNWVLHCGIKDLALKTSATRAGILEGLESYAAAAKYPDFTIFSCGDIDVADGIADETIFSNFTQAVTRIKAALPMTTVLACTIIGGSETLNTMITNWCASEENVEAVDLTSTMTSAYTAEECKATAQLFKAKLMTLATASGKNTPSGWTPPTVTLGAENNVPAAYRAGYTRVRSIEPAITTGYSQNLYAIPYAYAPILRETGITKVAYYIELVRADTGALQAMWVDMDAPGSTWADVALPVTHAQRKQQAVTKLHVWSNFGGVKQVAADDDSVTGFIEFNPVNYGGAEPSIEGAITEPWSGTCGFNDTFNTSGTSGHGCFQLMRKFDDADAFPAGEILFAYNRWGSTTANNRAIGMGTLADYANHGISTAKSLDWTYTYDGDATLYLSNYSYIKIDFWVQYDGETPARTDLAHYLWTGATDANFATAGNWGKDETAATTLAGMTIMLPEGVSQTFTYPGYDPVSLSTTSLMVDGTATFPEVGGIYLNTMDVGATGKLVYDPTKFTFRLVSAPTFVWAHLRNSPQSAS